MDHLNISLLKDLQARKANYAIKIRIIRLWKQPVMSNPKETHSIDMVFMDEQVCFWILNIISIK